MFNQSLNKGLQCSIWNSGRQEKEAGKGGIIRAESVFIRWSAGADTTCSVQFGEVGISL